MMALQCHVGLAWYMDFGLAHDIVGVFDIVSFLSIVGFDFYRIIIIYTDCYVFGSEFVDQFLSFTCLLYFEHPD